MKFLLFLFTLVIMSFVLILLFANDNHESHYHGSHYKTKHLNRKYHNEQKSSCYERGKEESKHICNCPTDKYDGNKRITTEEMPEDDDSYYSSTQAPLKRKTGDCSGKIFYCPT